MRIAIDTGGTFTDCVYLDAGTLRVLKVRSTPSNPADAVIHCLRDIANLENPEVRHGTTVGTNAMLERKGARVAFITTSGFQDLIAIGRQARPKLYDLFSPGPACLVPHELRFGVDERITAQGHLLRQPTAEDLAHLRHQIKESAAEAVAICTLFSFLQPDNERLIEAALRDLDLPVSTSHRILPEFREYERASTVVVNAYLMPIMQRYLLSLQQQIGTEYREATLQVMQSSGGILSASKAAAEPVRTVLSGPAGGVIGASRMAAMAGLTRIIGLDMGGTSTDVFLSDLAGGTSPLRAESQISGLPLGVPMLDIHTVGAGGGSIAHFDPGGLLRVGPESAGSQPGPICFGVGQHPTVTDANLLLGRLDTSRFVGGAVQLQPERARTAFEDLKGSLGNVEEFASGILRVVESNMERAIRFVSVERGLDPREFTLVAFGGGGPLHACAVARSLRIPSVLIPALPGALSALGILLADATQEFSRTVMLPQSALPDLHRHFVTLRAETNADFAPNAIEERTVDLRYTGQGYQLNVPYQSDTAELFHSLHQRQFGFADPNRSLEIVNLRIRLRTPSAAFELPQTEPRPGDGSQALCGTRQIYFDHTWTPANLYNRDLLLPGDVFNGPALIGEYTSTTVLPPDCSLEVDPQSNLRIHVPTPETQVSLP